MKKSDYTRQFIIEQSATTFNKKGYLGTSLSDITKATGLSKGALYGNFTGKNQIATACFEYNIGRLTGLINQRIRQAHTAEEKLHAYLHYYQENLEDLILRGGCPLMNTSIDTDDSNSLLFTKVQTAMIRWKNSIEAILQQGKESGEFREDISKEAFAYSFISLIEGGLLLSRTLGSTAPFTHNFQLLEQHIRGLLRT